MGLVPSKGPVILKSHAQQFYAKKNPARQTSAVENEAEDIKNDNTQANQDDDSKEQSVTVTRNRVQPFVDVVAADPMVVKAVFETPLMEYFQSVEGGRMLEACVTDPAKAKQFVDSTHILRPTAPKNAPPHNNGSKSFFADSAALYSASAAASSNGGSLPGRNLRDNILYNLILPVAVATILVTSLPKQYAAMGKSFIDAVWRVCFERASAVTPIVAQS